MNKVFFGVKYKVFIAVKFLTACQSLDSLAQPGSVEKRVAHECRQMCSQFLNFLSKKQCVLYEIDLFN